jgi:hypothetical protein
LTVIVIPIISSPPDESTFSAEAIFDVELLKCDEYLESPNDEGVNALEMLRRRHKMTKI